jgi:hypothetical protein
MKTEAAAAPITQVEDIPAGATVALIANAAPYAMMMSNVGAPPQTVPKMIDGDLISVTADNFVVKLKASAEIVGYFSRVQWTLCHIVAAPQPDGGILDA